MKKSLVLAMAMAMGLTASAYAANPFSDVPAGHWAYDSISKLAAAGVVDGYGTTFGGAKSMTRYEMAQIVAKAMAKGANCDKLAAEFSEELDALGVRVAKLEKKVDNVKIAGQIRFDYKDHDGKGSDGSLGRLRSRFFVNGQINNNWSYTGMLQIQRNMMSVAGVDDSVTVPRAYLEGRLGGLKVMAGRWNEFFICDTILDEYIDGVQATYDFGPVKLLGLASKWSHNAYGDHNGFEDRDRLYVLGASGKVGPVDLAFNYFKSTDGYGERNIYNFNADYGFAKDWGLTYRYMWTDDEVTPKGAKDGFYAQLNYKGADPGKEGTWGLRGRWFEQPENVWISPTYECSSFANDGGYEGWGLGGDYTFVKNVMLSVDYYDTESKGGSASDRTWHSQLWFFF